MSYDRELRRQFVHVVFGILVVVLFSLNLINLWVVLGLILLNVIFFLFRLRWHIPLIESFMKLFERPNEVNHKEGPLAYLVGMFVVLFLFDQSIALASIMVLALGDGASTVFGKLLGKTRIPWSKKTVEGSMFGIIFAFAGAVFFVKPVHAIIAVVAALLVESFDADLFDISDNILMPVVTGVVLTILAA